MNAPSSFMVKVNTRFKTLVSTVQASFADIIFTPTLYMSTVL